MNQPTLFDLQAFTKVDAPVYVHDPFWDELTPQKSHSVGGQISDLESPCKSVGEQVVTDTQKSAPQHDTHWVEKYWVERSGNRYWYFRYCWMVGRKINRLYLGSVNSTKSKRKKADVEIAISEGHSPQEIEELIRQQRGEARSQSEIVAVHPSAD
ncbi:MULTISPECIES: DUF4102 domain-containing protein [unclassified Nostoc]|uniref:DUF4102 domain-containing protein n=1 Tax=unclassified Nostoc TaxID=2593658 RepID=UPI002AD1ED6D|nr:DUF4102 domain-containing protein [Nostoc sp. DedQUE03]MDZ7975764.1 DUF4102 domain-containing protein [Nostoc sp. DedQUE03]MDZ8048297.1 DUF4102 domain-containing protein [Nostoc sp. DedQUE02]